MKVILSFVLLINAFASSMRRGPHHPHGQSSKEKHHHHRPKGDDSLTGETGVLHDVKHIEEDIKILSAEDLAQMSQEELEFYYFTIHDFDKNSKLDGLEMLKAVYHTYEHEHDDSDLESSIEPEVDNWDGYVDLVDRTLESDDVDGDGYVSYAEYRAARLNTPPELIPRVVLD